MSYKLLYSTTLLFLAVSLFSQSFEFGAELESAFYTSEQRVSNSEFSGIEFISDSLGVRFTGVSEIIKTISYSNEGSPVLLIGRNFKFSERDFLKLSIGFRALNVSRRVGIDAVNTEKVYGDTVSISRPEMETECDTTVNLRDLREFLEVLELTTIPMNNPIEYRSDKFNLSANYMRRLKNEIIEFSVGGYVEYSTVRRKLSRDLEIRHYGVIDSMGTVLCSSFERSNYLDFENLRTVNVGFDAGLWLNILPRLTTKFGIRRSFLDVFNNEIDHSYSPTYFSLGVYMRKHNSDTWFKGIFKKKTE